MKLKKKAIIYLAGLSVANFALNAKETVGNAHFHSNTKRKGK